MDYLFEDLDTLEANEQGRIHPPSTLFGNQPRELLIELFGKPPTIKAEDRPRVRPTEACERARLIGALTHDHSPRIAEAVRKIFVENAEDGYFATACLRCLANRGQSAFLIDQLGRIDVSSRQTNALHVKYIEGIAVSKEKPVREKLWEIIQATMNADYFVAALSVLDNDEKLPDLTTNLLASLPDDSKQGRTLLQIVGNKFPNEAPAIYRSFLNGGGTLRIETMCQVLWNGNPLSKTILAPFLDDKRELPGFAIPMRVCDRAAEAISHTTGKFKFDEAWGIVEKDAQIERLKAYCRER